MCGQCNVTWPLGSRHRIQNDPACFIGVGIYQVMGYIVTAPLPDDFFFFYTLDIVGKTFHFEHYHFESSNRTERKKKKLSISAWGGGQGRISHIGKLGMCLGRQLCRGGTPHQNKKNVGINSTHPHAFHSHLISQQYRVIWYQNDGN